MARIPKPKSRRELEQRARLEHRTARDARVMVLTNGRSLFGSRSRRLSRRLGVTKPANQPKGRTT